MESVRTVGKDGGVHGSPISRAEAAHKSGRQRKQKVRSGSLVRVPKAHVSQEALLEVDQKQIQDQQVITALNRANEELSTRVQSGI